MRFMQYATKEFIWYLAYRVLSFTFMVISIYYFMQRDEIFYYMLSGVFFILGIFFTVMHSHIQPTPHLVNCIEDIHGVLRNIILLLITISYGIAVLSVVRAIELSCIDYLLVTLVCMSVTLLSLTAYLYICQKKSLI